MVSCPSENSISDTVKSIRGSYQGGDYAPMLKSIKFLNYKNVMNDKSIDFNFPITLIVGPNGTNKTSILRALESCPRGKSLSDYWFSTELDPIPRPVSDSDNPEYVYLYDLPRGKGILAKVRKYMTYKDGRDDYFEPARRIEGDGYKELSERQVSIAKKYRKKDGWVPIPKKTVYIDMRQRVPAYDINMSYGFNRIFFEKQNEALKKKVREKYPEELKGKDKEEFNKEYNERKMTMKKYIRKSSVKISEVMNRKNVNKNRKYNRKIRFTKSSFRLEADELKWISYILGREYTEIVILDHSYFKLPGATVRVQVADKVADGEKIVRTYSEAYAGSGEYAVIMMVHYIYTAKRGSLILMDEPENSLHPESQRRLMECILHETLTKKHQFIISSHSMYMSESLPNEARIALSLNANGFVEPHMSVTHRDAFMGVGAAPQVPVGKVVIKVEDGLAEAMVRHVLLGSDDRSIQDRYIIDRIGSCSYAINTYIPADINRNASDTLWILDGDCNYREKDNINLRLEEKLGPNYGYDYYACRVALYYVTDVQNSSGANGYDDVVAYLDALENKSQDKVNECLKKVNDKVNKFIFSKGDAQREREERIQSTLSWLEKYVHYLPGNRNPESWILGQTVGINCDGNQAAKELISSHGREIRETCKLLTSEKINSSHILQYEIELLEGVGISKFEALLNVLKQYDG
jgi:hypothetical protein